LPGNELYPSEGVEEVAEDRRRRNLTKRSMLSTIEQYPEELGRKIQGEFRQVEVFLVQNPRTWMKLWVLERIECSAAVGGAGKKMIHLRMSSIYQSGA
jgi:hypothetical protein